MTDQDFLSTDTHDFNDMSQGDPELKTNSRSPRSAGKNNIELNEEANPKHKSCKN
jgi:hypothetical protein